MLLFLSVIGLALMLFGILLGAWLVLHNDLRWVLRPLDEGVPLDVLADALPYTGAGELEAMAVVDHLADSGWVIVPSSLLDSEAV